MGWNPLWGARGLLVAEVACEAFHKTI